MTGALDQDDEVHDSLRFCTRHHVAMKAPDRIFVRIDCVPSKNVNDCLLIGTARKVLPRLEDFQNITSDLRQCRCDGRPIFLMERLQILEPLEAFSPSVDVNHMI